ncbi:hypothetical protein [Desulfosoma caldarium]|uniref:Prepilin-type N-terminal cleavage/methylation domain-containing protein n=1 Tax=Desulfosoma caldarium TaxID=610254 RepID=A0A3N1VPW5_9BACT|nr:hypothetical protein [Desulfosoma caldarium]ROR01937.1 hypothetical protein EDC27_1133 [Desulfosoma caldarium]
MTLVELMVALAVTALVLAAVTGVFSSQHRNYVRDRSEKEVMQDAIDVLRVLQRDLMEAGWAADPNMAFLIRDGGASSPDEIFLNDVDLIDPLIHADRLVEASPCPGCLKVSSITGTKVELEDPWQPSSYAQEVMDINGDNETDFSSDNGTDFFIISDATGLDNKTASVDNVTDTTLTLASSLKGTLVTPAIYYCVDSGTACHPSGAKETFVLRRSDRRSKGALLPIAENVVDLQVAYQDDDGHWYGEAGCSDEGVGANLCERSPFEPRRIRLIRLSVVLRSPTKDKNLAGSCRPAVENRAAGTAPEECGYRYTVHTVLIHPRNTTKDK